MKTELLKPTINNFKKAKKLILNGELVAFPTETVYGLGANACNNSAIKKIFIAKNRPQDNPLISHFFSKKQIENYVLSINPIEKKIIKKFMPGSISLILQKNNKISDISTCGQQTVAIRIPKNKIARKFLKFCNIPICAPSANTSKRLSPTTAEDVMSDLNGKISAIIDGGRCKVGVESTVVKVIDNIIYILRPGKITKEMLEKKIRTTVIEKLKNETTTSIESPGTKYEHYCPLCEAILVKNNKLENFNNLLRTLTNKKILILCSPKLKNQLKGLNYDINIKILGKTSTQACANIFRLLRQNENNYDLILIEFIDNGNMQSALFNRLSKTVKGNII